jgi:hypothetical protein
MHGRYRKSGSGGGEGLGGREGIEERGIGMVEGRSGGRVRDREGLRGNEGAYCVEKEVENGRGREGGDPAFYTPPPIHPCMYVSPYITS